MRRLLFRFFNVFRRERADYELTREMDAHLALLEDEHVRRGMTREDARRAARRAIGSVALTKDLHRDARSFAWLDDALTDVKHTVRSLRRAPVFTAVAVMTLAIGVGANTAIFSVLNAVLLRPLPFEDGDRLVRVVMTVQAPGQDPRRDPVRLSVEELDQLRTSARTLSMVGQVEPTLMNLRGRDPRTQGAVVSAGFFEMLRARPLLGRVFTAVDEMPGASPVILLSYETWRRHFGGDPQIVGRTATFDPVLGPRVSTDYTVIGVMPADFQFPSSETNVWRPPQVAAAGPAGPRTAILAQLAAGVSLEAAASEILPLMRQIRATYRDNANASYELVGVHQELVRPVRPALIILSVAVGLVLLLACVNVANLVLARTASRQGEIAIRRALGAGRGRLIRHFLTESMMLGLCGGLVGALLAVGGVRLLRSLATTLTRVDLGNQLSIPRIDEIGVDGTALAFAFGVSIATAVLFGLAPALRYARPGDSVALREGERATAEGYRPGSYLSGRSALIVGEIGLAMILLAGGGLLIRSFIELLRVDAGYDPSNVATFQVAVPADSYPPARSKMFAEELVARLRSVPVVESAAYANQLPMVSLVNSFPLGSRPRPRPLPGPPPSPPPQPPPNLADIRLVSRDYFKAMGIRVLSGRGFVESDGASGRRVMLINEALARRDFANRNPVGETVFINYFEVPWQIVGVVADVRQFGLALDPQPQFFIDMRQWTDVDALVFPAGAYYAVRTNSNSASLVPTVRAIVEQMDAQASLFYVAPMEQVVASTLSRPRLYATLLGVFSIVGLGLAVIGIYGVMSYSVTQRTREIGIRVALGARRGQVIALVLGQSAVLTAVGIVLGLSGAAMLSRYLEGLLFGVTPLDPVTFAAAAVLFTLVALVAAYGPTRRATGVDPLVALRAE